MLLLLVKYEVVSKSDTPPLQTHQCFLLFIVVCRCLLCSNGFLNYVCAKVCLSLLASHVGAQDLGQVQAFGRVKKRYLKRG